MNDTSLPSGLTPKKSMTSIASKKLACMPTPYGTIPRRTKKKQKTSNASMGSRQQKATTPYPFFTPSTGSVFSLIVDKLFHNMTRFGCSINSSSCNSNTTGHIGFMPCTTPHTNKTQTSELEIIIPVTSSTTPPMNCHYNSHYHYNSGGSNGMSDSCSLLSTSSSSYSSTSSSGKTIATTPMDDYYNVSTTSILSDILCDHYVQTQINTITPSLSDTGANGNNNTDDSIDVPLETFCIYEAPVEGSEKENASTVNASTTTVSAVSTLHAEAAEEDFICQKGDQLNWMISYLLPNTEFEQNKEWTLVETLSNQEKKTKRPRTKRQHALNTISTERQNAMTADTTEQEDDDDNEDEEERIEEADTDNESDQEKQLPKDVSIDLKNKNKNSSSSSSSSSSSTILLATNKKKNKAAKSYYFQHYHHNRDVRANAAYLRIIVAEVNMMRSQKIVGPLRQRRVLPKRADRFIRRPSPLQLIIV
ncbi:hypothetical protein BDF20DRAFT_838294 [Mycotypha africana]|uniref:uncharacterized protein n=1 Tax=Mycotypha africana TaxID=64632 RepID=UPI002300B097|nr:uncharacterized protein BDF20DRAFT_838294 [Mycotypha africana]KAI8972027.1 hypothetical protein BDF20DRAFT_838294 [Mycotypha africana]